MTIHRRDAVIDLAQWPGEWTLSKEHLLCPSDVAAHAQATDATDGSIPQVEPEWEWIQDNEDSLREDYAGRWIAVLLNRVVAIGSTEIEVLRSTESLGYGSPFTFHVPTESEPIAMAGCSWVSNAANR